MLLSNLFLTPGAKLPLYTFSKSNAGYALNSFAGKQPCSPFLDALFKAWEERKTRGLFHHDITNSPMKILQGELGFITTLVEGRDQKKRPTEFKIDQVLQPFNKEKFNFTKVAEKEVIFLFEQGKTSGTGYFECSSTTDGCYSPNAILINVSPIGYGHVLLIPHLLDCLPQRMDHDSFYLALCMAKQAGSRYFRVGYNSLGGFATINHLHFQANYLEAEFPVEKAKTKEIQTLESKVKISELTSYPIRGLVFEGEASLDDLCGVVSLSTVLLQKENTPFNVLISESGKRIFLLLQCYAKKLALGQVRQELVETQINPAVWELSGHLVLKRRKDYEVATETSLSKLLAEAALPENQFQEVKKNILSSVVQRICKS
ncbi:hypothetical protein LUZ63_004177 [Rhynchospora breviuscula]|uniref:GDP-L-galactose phosphorylase n=1 Tax=Rhynchospora breviuscula TaxID=2022672 RepID=A0A9Q0I116_9POAL|nr:hypothetical protein LUZ63_004177 [Rhynchospora breviuscula]